MLFICAVQIVPKPSKVQPACCHRSASIRVIPVFSLLDPTGTHRPASVEEIGLISDCFAKIRNHQTWIFCICRVQIVPCSADPLPARYHRSASIRIVPAFWTQYPTCRHRSASVEKVLCSANIFPAVRKHQSRIFFIRTIQIIPGTP